MEVTTNNLDGFKRKCFFCSKPINGRKTLEHIIPNSLLGKLEIKELTLSGNDIYSYSKIKVPAHEECNSGFGSQYESKVIKLLDEPENLYVTLTEEEIGIPIVYSADNSATSIISTWLSKVYYGLFYHDYLKTQDTSWKEISRTIIECSNFDLIRKSYRNGHGFYMPSSLFAFKLSKNSNFDLKTSIIPQCILVKIKNIAFVLCIGDGFLTKNYLNGDPLYKLRAYLNEVVLEQEDFPTHLLAWSEILSLQMCMPKSKSYYCNGNEITNMSLSTMVTNPQEYYAIDENKLEEYRNSILRDLGISCN
jgi:hypothetical protein